MIQIKATPKWVCKILKLPFTKVTYRRTPTFFVPKKTADSLVDKGYATLVVPPQVTPPIPSIISPRSSKRSNNTKATDGVAEDVPNDSGV